MDTTPTPATSPEPAAPAVPTLPAGLRFDTTPYTPDGGFSVTGLLLVLIGLAVAGVVMGAATFYVSKLFYLILLFPFLIGLALGALGGFLVKQGKVRAPWLAGAAGLLAGILAMLTCHYLNYHGFMEDTKLDRETFKANPVMANLFMLGIPAAERDLQKRGLKVENFFDFIEYNAHVGVSLKRAGGNDKGMNLGYYGTYIYWGVETLIVACLVFAMTRKPAQEPFCSLTNEWKVVRCGDNFLVPMEVGLEQAADTFKEGALGKLAEIKAQGANSAEKAEPVRLYVYASPQHFDQCALDVKLVKFVAGKQGQTEEKELVKVTYSADALPSFEKFCG